MNNRIYKAFDQIHASEELKSSTQDILLSKINSSQTASLSIPVPNKKFKFMHYSAILAACLLLFFCGAGGYSLYRTPVSFISIDVNPSIELSLNRFDRIVDAKGYNDDGTIILKGLNLENKYYTDGVETLLADPDFLQYLSRDSSLLFTVISEEEQKLQSGIEQCRGYEENKASCHGSSEGIMEEAHHNGMSFGKYEVYLELSSYDSSITLEECSQMSMCEIRSLISRYTKKIYNDNEDNHRKNSSEDENNSQDESSPQENSHHKERIHHD